MAKTKIQLEYVFNVIPSVLYSQISTSSGLSSWFADSVNINSDKFIFMWSESEDIAFLIASKQNVYVRFRWEDDTDHHFFEFRIIEDELTSEVSLIVTDFVDEEDKDDQVELWNTQIEVLRRTLGV